MGTSVHKDRRKCRNMFETLPTESHQLYGQVILTEEGNPSAPLDSEDIPVYLRHANRQLLFVLRVSPIPQTNYLSAHLVLKQGVPEGLNFTFSIHVCDTSFDPHQVLKSKNFFWNPSHGKKYNGEEKFFQYCASQQLSGVVFQVFGLLEDFVTMSAQHSVADYLNISNNRDRFLQDSEMGIGYTSKTKRLFQKAREHHVETNFIWTVQQFSKALCCGQLESPLFTTDGVQKWKLTVKVLTNCEGKQTLCIGLANRFEEESTSFSPVSGLQACNLDFALLDCARISGYLVQQEIFRKSWKFSVGFNGTNIVHTETTLLKLQKRMSSKTLKIYAIISHNPLGYTIGEHVQNRVLNNNLTGDLEHFHELNSFLKGQAPLTNGSAETLLPISHSKDMPELKLACERELALKLSEGNIKQRLNNAIQYDCSLLFRSCIYWLVDNFSKKRTFIATLKKDKTIPNFHEKLTSIDKNEMYDSLKDLKWCPMW